VLFAGDAMGVRLPRNGVLRPAAPPPDFDLNLALGTLKLFDEIDPNVIALAHYGAIPNPKQAIVDYGDMLTMWVEVARGALERNVDVYEVFLGMYAYENDGIDEESIEILEKLNSLRTNVEGITRYLKKSEGD
jgi:hypothetical protein